MRTRRWTILALAALLGVMAPTPGCVTPYGGFISVGTAIDILPHGYVAVTVGGDPYYYHRGIFYRRYRRGYLVVPAPLGAVVVAPPPGYVMLLVENDPFYYYRGVFYQPLRDRYRVVRAPYGAFVRALPPGAIDRRVDGVQYKEYAGVWYRPAVRDGKRGYQVTEPPERR